MNHAMKETVAHIVGSSLGFALIKVSAYIITVNGSARDLVILLVSLFLDSSKFSLLFYKFCSISRSCQTSQNLARS